MNSAQPTTSPPIRKPDATLAYAWGKDTTHDTALPQMPPLDARFGLTYSEDNWSAGAGGGIGRGARRGGDPL